MLCRLRICRVCRCAGRFDWTLFVASWHLGQFVACDVVLTLSSLQRLHTIAHECVLIAFHVVRYLAVSLLTLVCWPPDTHCSRKAVPGAGSLVQIWLSLHIVTAASDSQGRKEREERKERKGRKEREGKEGNEGKEGTNFLGGTLGEPRGNLGGTLGELLGAPFLDRRGHLAKHWNPIKLTLLGKK